MSIKIQFLSVLFILVIPINLSVGTQPKVTTSSKYASESFHTKPQLSIKSTLGRVIPRELGHVDSSSKDEWKDGPPPEDGDSTSHKDSAVEEKSDGILDSLVLGLPVLFVPALLLALLYIIWAASYSSYNYHNNYPQSYGVLGGPAVGFGHYGNGGAGGHSGSGIGIGSGGYGWRKTDRTGTHPSKFNLTQKVDHLTPSVLAGLEKKPTNIPNSSKTSKS